MLFLYRNVRHILREMIIIVLFDAYSSNRIVVSWCLLLFEPIMARVLYAEETAHHTRRLSADLLVLGPPSARRDLYLDHAYLMKLLLTVANRRSSVYRIMQKSSKQIHESKFPQTAMLR